MYLSFCLCLNISSSLSLFYEQFVLVLVKRSSSPSYRKGKIININSSDEKRCNSRHQQQKNKHIIYSKSPTYLNKCSFHTDVSQLDEMLVPRCPICFFYIYIYFVAIYQSPLFKANEIKYIYSGTKRISEVAAIVKNKFPKSCLFLVARPRTFFAASLRNVILNL